ncbi:Rha family transcriptional regulator [Symbiopectobacterium sp. Eva_TO]
MALPALAENLHIEEPRVFINNGKALTTSRDVADYFGKRHERVLDKIKNLDCSAIFNQHNFVLVDYVDAKGEKRPMFEMTKDGFVFLVMGFTGKKAAAFKEAYIAEFNRMEERLHGQRQTKQPSTVTQEEIDAHYAECVAFHLNTIKKIWFSELESALLQLSYPKAGFVSEHLRDVSFCLAPLISQLKSRLQPGQTPRLH